MRRIAITGAAVAAALIQMLPGGSPAQTLAAAPGQTRAAARAGASERPPLIIVIFDALPPLMLQTADRQIDAVRFPNFAALGDTATWYRNATTVSESTRFSIPAMLDGRLPRPGQRENWLGHPDNIFTTLQGQYRLNDREDASQVCPPTLCKTIGSGSVIQRLSHGRVGRFQQTVRRITRGSEPQLTVLHTLITHEPRQYLPDGRRYQLGGSIDLAIDGTESYNRKFLTEQSEQRTLLQDQFADRLLGRLRARLEAEGIWDSAAVAVMSDHGESYTVKKTPAKPFQIGQLTYRRAVTPANIGEIAGVTMFIKYPHQRSGAIDTRYVRTIDMTATLYRLAGLSPRGPIDGRSLLDPDYSGQQYVSVRRQSGGAVTLPAPAWHARTAGVLARRIALFGTGDTDLFRFGPRPDLYDKPLAAFELLPRTGLRASILDAKQFAHVHGDFVPAHVIGRLKGARPQNRVLALAVNGTIAATVPTYRPLGHIRFNFTAMLQPASFKPGRNALRIFEVVGDRLRPLD